MSYQGYPPASPYGQPPPPQGGGYYQQPPPQQHHQQSPYGAPPPHASYNAYQQPPQAYGQPPPGPPPGQYGAPPPQPYGAPAHSPPPGQYGAPPPPHAPYYPSGPPQAGYGAPPPHAGGYGQPPGPPPHQPYGAPPATPTTYPPQPYAVQYPPTPPSPGYGPAMSIPWNPDPDADRLRKAMKGWGTDEKELIRVLADKDPLQINLLREAFSKRHRRDLIADIKSETSSWFEEGLVMLARGPLLNDVHMLYNAMDGAGTNEDILNDILLRRSNADLKAIKAEFSRVFRRSLEEMVRGELSMKTERHFMIVLGATRAEDAAPVVKADIDRDVDDIYNATEGKIGTDEMRVCSILSLRNNNQIRAISYEYRQKYARDLDTVIQKQEFSGHMKDALLIQLRHGTDKYMLQARLLEDAMAGLGTKDRLLTSRLVRAHWDRENLRNVKNAYEQRYKTKLYKRVQGETSGDYQRLLVAICGEPI
ncbi:unnamed protein product [Sordaria macrospora k-hell]|uniref:Annexin n=2 Tax=Sordaria macrospora TaxID=5147 RepID=F7W8H2_SORMK|nr:uncharacterized protein SMAC_07326 [Sordaria macrospora k-hell]KAH7631241.1 hypothetical protein B0T09DRAFT_365608 [Sordaria sp. MPI-SDFR-AT-0083]CCC05003.1 unnamed protein product [Sordaria macrospora k-hell]